ncbi:cytochrome C assembly family protein [Vandammella animalimorsus]|uniref:Cytochrome C assembly protein n=1 Tax=Vandammella animalimorsus TaxID=2029117 RepID=A0A2A2AAR2_9BURK|nr:cytochrome c biogenesis protein CcsA [Vandammella animalimorsus]PAT34814.1 cytochrome C assembly protein [Vandammella animalimorsus]
MIVPSAPAGPPMALAIAAATAYLLTAALALRGSQGHPPRLALLAAWLLHLLVIALGFLQHGLHFGFGPALSVTGWLVLTVYAIEYQVLPRLPAQRWLMVMGALSVLIGALFPGQALNEKTSPWMAVHLALGIASYGLFAAAVAHGWLMRRAEKRMRTASSALDGQHDTELPLLALERLTFRFAQAGFALLTATFIAGFFFGEQVNGSAWAWRHKEVFAALAWLTFAALLWARWRQGLRGKKAVRLLNAGAVLLLLAYVGSRFVLEVLLQR